MHLVLDPAQDAAHGTWLRETRAAYEWWYFDAVSDDGVWSLACIWFLGNPFSPYYRHAARGEAADPFTHNALFFALSHRGRLHAYHFTRFRCAQVCADEVRPAHLRFGPNALSLDDGGYRVRLSDENANCRVLTADLTFRPPAPLIPRPLLPRRGEAEQEGRGKPGPYDPLTREGEGRRLAAGEREAGDSHFWLPAAPVCRVSGRITLREAQNPGAEAIAFSGRGYHDHNWGTLPFSSTIHDWYWARVALSDTRALIVYHVNSHRPRPPVSHLLLFDGGRLLRHDPQAHVELSRPRLNAFGTACATCLQAQSGDLAANFTLGHRLDSAPFYLRTLCQATLTMDGRTETGTGMAEYFRPRLLSSRLAASATKARIVDR